MPLPRSRGIPLNPQVNSVNYFDNVGHSSYNAMIAGLKHQFSHQFMLDAELTWGRSMDTSSAPYEEQFYPYDPSLNWGRSDYDIRRQEKIFGMWQPMLFPRPAQYAGEAGGRMVDQRNPEPAHRIPVDAVSMSARWEASIVQPAVTRTSFPPLILAAPGTTPATMPTNPGPALGMA